MKKQQKTITFLIGIPGSGKSYWLNNIVQTNENRIFDDISQTDPQLKNLTTTMNDINICNIYIADVNFLQQGIIEKAQERLLSINKENENIVFKYVIFLGNKEVCTKNVEFRQDGRNVKGTIDRFEKSIERVHNEYKYHPSAQFIEVKDYSIIKQDNMNRIKI